MDRETLKSTVYSFSGDHLRAGACGGQPESARPSLGLSVELPPTPSKSVPPEKESPTSAVEWPPAYICANSSSTQPFPDDMVAPGP